MNWLSIGSCGRMVLAPLGVEVPPLHEEMALHSAIRSALITKGGEIFVTKTPIAQIDDIATQLVDKLPN